MSRAVQEESRASVVPESRPHLVDLLLGRGGERGGGGPTIGPAEPVLRDALDLGLLGHDLADPHAVGVLLGGDVDRGAGGGDAAPVRAAGGDGVGVASVRRGGKRVLGTTVASPGKDAVVGVVPVEEGRARGGGGGDDGQNAGGLLDEVLAVAEGGLGREGSVGRGDRVGGCHGARRVARTIETRGAATVGGRSAGKGTKASSSEPRRRWKRRA